MKTRFQNATVLTMNHAGDILHHAQVDVTDGIITAISQNATEEDAVDRVIDCREDVLMPGLINAHTHISMSLFRNFGNDVALKSWLEDYIWPLEDRMQPEDMVAGAKLSMLEMLRSGTTTFVDMYMEEDAIAKAVEEIGMRAVLCPGFTDNSVQEERPAEVKRLMAYHHGAEDRIRVLLAPHAVYTCSPDTLRKVKVLGDALGVGFHIHVAETRQEDEACRARYGVSPTTLLHEAGLLGPTTILAHAVWLDARDRDLIAESGATCVYNPVSNMKLASGFMPFTELVERGIPLAIGTDGASSNNTQDLFRDMMVGSLLQKGHTLDPTAASAHQMLYLATRGGAHAIGQEDALGSIEVGKKADLILVDFNNVRHTPRPEDVEAALVYATSSADVRLTMVDGHILMQDGAFPNVDVEDIRQRAEASRHALLQRKEAQA